MPKSVFNPTLAVALVALVLGLGLSVWQFMRSAPVEFQIATKLSAPRPLPAFILTDQDEKPFGPAEMRGRWQLLFFGFTHCPDVCPNTLGLLASTRRQLGDERLQVVFVSVDPGRDTPAKLREYVRYFDKGFVGVTGSVTAIDALTAGLHMPYLIGKPNAEGHYDVEHSGALVLVSPEGMVSAYISPPFTPQQLVQDLRILLQAS